MSTINCILINAIFTSVFKPINKGLTFYLKGFIKKSKVYSNAIQKHNCFEAFYTLSFVKSESVGVIFWRLAEFMRPELLNVYAGIVLATLYGMSWRLYNLRVSQRILFRIQPGKSRIWFLFACHSAPNKSLFNIQGFPKNNGSNLVEQWRLSTQSTFNTFIEMQ